MNDISIRPWQKQDAQALAQIANNRAVWNNLRDAIPNPYTVMDALRWISQASQQSPLCHFAIVQNGVLVGNIGCTPQTDIYRKTMEVGYFIGQTHWGKGIATKAVEIIIDYVWKNFDVVRIEARTLAYNHASMRVLQKNGFTLEVTRKNGAFKNNELVDEQVWVLLRQPLNSM